jgi:palmitoyltransferase
MGLIGWVSSRCILRMDHHCPWTSSCIGYRNTPHFLRFLFYTTATTSYLLLHLLQRAYAVWLTRHMPAYYSPHSLPQLILLAFLLLLDGPLSLTLLVLFLRTTGQVVGGYTTIETWELDRHRALVRRRAARNQIFPYDVGLWENLVAAFGYRWFFPGWLNPFARSPKVGEKIPWIQGGIAGGIEWEINGFEPVEREWPPRDPEKEARRDNGRMERSGTVHILEDSVDRVDWAGEVRRRQMLDRKRWETKATTTRRRCGEHIGDSFLNEQRRRRSGSGWVRVESPQGSVGDWGESSVFSVGDAEEWRNDDGERLADYGVDEEVEDEDENVPLALLLSRRRAEAERVGRVLGEVNPNKLWD